MQWGYSKQLSLSANMYSRECTYSLPATCTAGNAYALPAGKFILNGILQLCWYFVLITLLYCAITFFPKAHHCNVWWFSDLLQLSFWWQGLCWRQLQYSELEEGGECSQQRALHRVWFQEKQDYFSPQWKSALELFFIYCLLIYYTHKDWHTKGGGGSKESSV